MRECGSGDQSSVGDAYSVVHLVLREDRPKKQTKPNQNNTSKKSKIEGWVWVGRIGVVGVSGSRG